MSSSPVYHAEKVASWDGIQGQCRFLAQVIHRDAPDLRKILTITRGGMNPAAIIARELNIRQIETIGLASYDAQNRGDISVLKGSAPDYMRDVLVVDDLADTGATLQFLTSRLIGSRVATLFVKPQGRPFVDWFAEEVSQDTWVRFPWDTVRQYVPPLVS